LGPVFEGPGLALLISCGFAVAVLGVRGEGTMEAGRRTVRKWLPTAGAVLTFVLAGQVISASEAAALLASGTGTVGGLYGILAPVVGALGGALTGSNAASNALFMPPQIEAASGLGIGEPLVAAVQNVSGSHASMLAPQRTVLAAGAVGLLGREGEVVRAAVPPVLVSIAVLAVLGALVL
jgi:lactate permease